MRRLLVVLVLTLGLVGLAPAASSLVSASPASASVRTTYALRNPHARCRIGWDKRTLSHLVVARQRVKVGDKLLWRIERHRVKVHGRWEWLVVRPRVRDIGCVLVAPPRPRRRRSARRQHPPHSRRPRRRHSP